MLPTWPRRGDRGTEVGRERGSWHGARWSGWTGLSMREEKCVRHWPQPWHVQKSHVLITHAAPRARGPCRTGRLTVDSDGACPTHCSCAEPQQWAIWRAGWGGGACAFHTWMTHAEHRMARAVRGAVLTIQSAGSHVCIMHTAQGPHVREATGTEGSWAGLCVPPESHPGRGERPRQCQGT